jgi:hypothetical protein
MSEELSPPPSLPIPALDATVGKHVAKWRELLGETTPDAPFLDANSIRNQLSNALWDLVRFSGLAHARQIMGASGQRLPFSRDLHLGIDDWHFTSQLVALRKLLDKSPLWQNRPTGSDEGSEAAIATCSVIALLNDVSSIRKKITREQLFAIWRECPDLQKVRAAEEDSWAQASRRPSGTYETTSLRFDTEECSRLHLNADCLCSVSPDARSQSDTLSQIVAERLLERLKRHGRLCDGTNKFVAHAATLTSRLTAGITDFTYKQEHLLRAFEDCTRVVALFELVLNRRSFSLLPGDTMQRATRGYFDADSPLQTELESQIKTLVDEINGWPSGCPFEWLNGLAGGSESRPAPPP